MEKWKKVVLTILGIFYIALGLTAYYNTIVYGFADQVIWLCYLVLLIIGIAMLKRDSFMLASQMNIMTFPLIVWSIDFLFLIVGGQSLLGITDYFLSPGPITAKIISLQHIFTIPLGFFAIYLIKLKRNDFWKVSFIQMAAVFFVTLFLTAPENNINCVFSSCVGFNIPGYYPLIWFVSVFALIGVTNFVISRLKFLYER